MPEGETRTAVITGGFSGIRQATAHAFAERGWNLVLAARSEADLETVAAECRAMGAKVLVVPTDVGDAAAVRELAAQARAFAGTIDLWFSNVGVGAVGRFLDVPIETHEQIIRSNLIGHLNDAHAALEASRTTRLRIRPESPSGSTGACSTTTSQACYLSRIPVRSANSAVIFIKRPRRS